MLRAGTLLALGGAAAPLTGCGLFDRDDEPPEPDPHAPLVDESLRLAAGLRAAATADPDLAGRLVPLAEAHEAHATELARVIGTATPSGTAAPSASPSEAPPADRAATLTALRQAERAGRDTATQACAAASAERAALLGSIAAARATHLEALR
ncbi:hypothetical protein C1I95_22300 [Micromonospora craterilacus]|uniref:DUF305 domain-containing protein n=1 Tax=Micromonospora craterilacus TaxID=1655439 RepID=A0A2W2DVI3_9ACTN|nr:hypothetical protein [Micromonospora craterilacus]PZG14191.1 hypothetical protein C1I95_22300 [Micromonospora craterilacus]